MPADKFNIDKASLLKVAQGDEQLLLKQVAEGNENSFRNLIHQYADLLGSHIYKITHSKEQTEEIVQDIFLKIWMTRETLTEVRNFKTYLYVISRNHAMNVIRSLIREKKRHGEWEKSNYPHQEEAESNLKEQQLSVIDEAIAQLPPQQKTAWLLSRKKGLKYRDIALQMNLSQETVKKYIQYANSSIIKYVESHLGLILLGLIVNNITR